MANAKPKEADLPENGTCGRIFIYLMISPGSSAAEIRKNLGIANGTLSHHLDALIDLGFVVEKRTKTTTGGKRVIKTFHPRTRRRYKIGSVNVGPKHVRILRTVRDSPGIEQQGIVKTTGLPQATVSRLLKELRRADILVSEFDDEDGRRRYGLRLDQQGKIK